MNETNRFFVVINRINSVLLLVIFLLAAGGIILTVFMESKWIKNRTIEVKDISMQGKMEKIKLRLGHIEQVYGTPVQLVRLETEPKGGKLSSGYYPEVTRNIMFLTKELKEARWLFPKHHFLIKTVDKLCENRECSEKCPTLAIYYEIIKEDTNGDGKLTENDNAVVALSRVDGSDYVELGLGLQRIIGHKIINQGTEVAVLGEKDGKVLYMTYSLRDFSKISEIIITEITDKL